MNIKISSDYASVKLSRYIHDKQNSIVRVQKHSIGTFIMKQYLLGKQALIDMTSLLRCNFGN